MNRNGKYENKKFKAPGGNLTSRSHLIGRLKYAGRTDGKSNKEGNVPREAEREKESHKAEKKPEQKYRDKPRTPTPHTPFLSPDASLSPQTLPFFPQSLRPRSIPSCLPLFPALPFSPSPRSRDSFFTLRVLYPRRTFTTTELLFSWPLKNTSEGRHAPSSSLPMRPRSQGKKDKKKDERKEFIEWCVRERPSEFIFLPADNFF